MVAKNASIGDRDRRPDRLNDAPVGKAPQRRRHRLDEIVHRQHGLDVGFGQEAETDAMEKLPDR